MENIFTNKRIWKKLVIAMLFIMAFQTIFSIPIVKADDEYGLEEGDNLGWGGVLLKPVMSLLLTIGDGVMNILHSAIMGTDVSLLHIDLMEGNVFWKVLKLLITAIVLVVAAVAAIATFGGTTAVCLAILAVIGGTVIGVPVVAPIIDGASRIGSTVASTIWGDYTPEDIYLPIYTYTPEELFRGNILLFNVDFFSDSKKIYICYRSKIAVDAATGTEETFEPDIAQGVDESQTVKNIEYKLGDTDYFMSYDDYLGVAATDKALMEIKYYYYYKDGNSGNNADSNIVKTSPQDSAIMLRGVVSKWYVTIRYICIVGMLSVLLYVGIKMMLSSVASEKAKYKEMIKDWTVGLCLLFLMHYIMAFSVALVDKVTLLIGDTVDNNIYAVLLYSPDDGNTENDLSKSKLDNFKKGLEESGLTDLTTDESGNIIWPTNLMGYLRLKMQFDKANGQYIGEVICFLVLVIYTILFTFTYFRRLLYMAFLTMISPFVALTYCIDKLNDGQAQGFNKWLKEYIFNLLIQPVHLLLYYVLVTSAFDLAGTNVIYSLVALGFMIPAEKLLRSLFGFEKATTPPLLGGPVGTALVMQGMNMLKGVGGRGAGGKDGKKGTSADDDSDTGKTRFQSAEMWKNLSSGEGSDGSTDSSSGAAVALPGGGGPAGPSIGGAGTDGDTSSKWATPELDEKMAALDQEERDLREMAWTDVRTPEQFDAWRDLKGEIDEKRSQALLEDYKIRMANQQAMNQATAEPAEVQDDSSQIGEIHQVPAPQLPQMGGTASESTGGGTNSSSNSQGQRNFVQKAGRSIRRLARSSGAAAKYALKSGAKRTVKGVAKQLPKMAVKAVGGAATGAFVGGLGVAAGIATGDPKNVMTGAAAGVAAASRGVPTPTLSKETRAAFDEVYHSEEYEQDDRDKLSKELRTDDLTRLKVEQRLGDKQKADEFLRKGGHYDAMIQKGVTDIDRAIALEQGIQEGDFGSDDAAVDRAVAHSKFYDQIGQKDPTLGKMSGKEEDSFTKTIRNGLRGNNSSISDTEVSAKTEEIRGRLAKLHGRLNP